ncbi:MAG: bifunctional UDP-sugar hydrolase/5'-nucleotidase [Acidobacteria bacterium]|nr:bifunctional UDP-sugar hydrolase/5'-nucleotidase [Acidobacteriota bacterium]
MSTSRRLVLLLLLVVLALSGQQNIRSLTILHTNDLHARLTPNDSGLGGFAYLKTVIDQQRAGSNSCLLLNGGDLVQGTPVSTIFKGVPIYALANRFGYDASVLGNHDFDYGWQLVEQFRRKAKFPILSANVVNASGQLIADKPYVIRKVNGIRVAILGITMGSLASYSMPQLLGTWHALPVAPAIEKYARELQGKYDLLVVLSHLESGEEKAVLENAPSAAVTIAGHVHTGLASAEENDGRVLVYVKGYGVELGRLDLQVDVARQKVASWKWTRIPIDSKKIAPDRGMQAAVAGWEKKVAKVVDVTIGEAKRELVRDELRHILERAVADEAKTDFAYLNPGGIRDKLPKGAIQVRTIWRIMPFDNKVVTARVKGSTVPAASAGGRTLDPNADYTLAVPDFVADNPVERKRMGLEQIEFQPQTLLVRDAIVAWIKSRRVVE